MSHQRKLTPEQVLEIRSYKPISVCPTCGRWKNLSAIARRFGVDAKAVRNVVDGRTYKEVGDGQ